MTFEKLELTGFMKNKDGKIVEFKTIEELKKNQAELKKIKDKKATTKNYHQ